MRLAFSSTVVAQVSDFEHSVAQIPDSLLLDATGLVLRVDAQLWLTLTSNDAAIARALDVQAKDVARRAPGVEVYVVPDGHSSAEARPAYAARHSPRLLFGSTGDAKVFEPVDASTLLAIRQQDLALCIEGVRARCVICAASNYHFALPSGAHASQFLRLAEAFVDIETVDRIAYWVALDIQSKVPVLRGNEQYALLVDHPSMLILASRVQLLVSVPLEIVAFPTYPSDVETRTATFDLLKRVSSRCSTAFVLIGVASTGRLAKFIDHWAQTVPELGVASTVLCAIRELEGINALCRIQLPEYLHFSSAESCELCASQSHPVSIQSSNYMVAYGPAAPVALPTTAFNEQRPFLERWGRHPGVLRVHYDDPNESTARHHAFYVDIGTLLTIPEFEQEVLTAIGRLEGAPDVVAVPDHPTAIRLGELVAGALGAPVVVLNATLLSKGQGPLDPSLLAASCVLVLDDVYITGKRFDVINRFFREHKSERAPHLTRIHYWTVLATPPSESKYKRSSNGMTMHHGWTAALGHLYKLTLPDWHSSEQCPWCRERTVLSRLAQSAGELDGPLANRLTELSNPTAGITEAPYFLASPRTTLPGLGAQSALLHEGATPLQVLFSCAGGIQQLRHAATNTLNADQFPAPSHLAERVFAQNYSERLIWLGMLRSLKGNELDAALKSFLRRVALDRSDEQRPLVHAELAMAWVTGKLDAIQVSAESKEFFEAVGIAWQALFDNGLVDAVPEAPTLQSMASAPALP